MAIPKILNDLREIRDESITATSVSSADGVVTLVLPISVSNGSLVKFKAPCDCSEVQNLSIEGTLYTVVDTLGNTVTGQEGAWVADSLVSVILDTDTAKAYIQGGSGGGSNSLVTTLIPKGRMKGDINGDGYINADDLTLFENHNSGIQKITDEVGLWCLDVTGNGTVASNDLMLFRQALDGLTNLRQSDYYSNWTYVTDDTSGYFYTDIAVKDITSTSSATVVITGSSNTSIFKEAVCLEGIVRIQATACPIADVPCLIIYGEGDGTASIVADTTSKQDTITGTEGQIVGFDSSGNPIAQDISIDIFVAKYDVSTNSEIYEASSLGEACICVKGSVVYISSEDITSSRAVFYNPVVNENLICSDGVWTSEEGQSGGSGNITYGTEELTAGVSALPTGAIHLVYV